MLAASVSISASRRSGSTTRFTSPRACACAASMKSPVTSISNAGLRATLRDSGTLGVEQKRPRLTPLTANLAALEATARSHCATSWQPAAVAIPCTRAITGTGRRRSVSIMRVHCANSPREYSSEGCARISFRSWPAQNALPTAAITTTRADASLAIASSSRCSAASIASDRALKACGRLSVRVMTPRASRSGLTSGSESPLGSGSAVMVVSSFDRTGRFRPLAQHELLDLAGGGLRDLLEAHLARHLVGRQQGAAMRDELGGAHRDAALELDEGEGRLAPFRIGPRHHCAGHHRGVAIERILHLQGADVLPAGDDHVLAAVLDLHVSVRLQHRQIPAVKPAAGEGLGGCGPILPVAPHHDVAAGHDLTQRLPVGRDLRPGLRVEHPHSPLLD